MNTGIQVIKLSDKQEARHQASGQKGKQAGRGKGWKKNEEGWRAGVRTRWKASDNVYRQEGMKVVAAWEGGHVDKE